VYRGSSDSGSRYNTRLDSEGRLRRPVQISTLRPRLCPGPLPQALFRRSLTRKCDGGIIPGYEQAKRDITREQCREHYAASQLVRGEPLTAAVADGHHHPHRVCE
jgi:hypothetical protein